MSTKKIKFLINTNTTDNPDKGEPIYNGNILYIGDGKNNKTNLPGVDFNKVSKINTNAKGNSLVWRDSYGRASIATPLETNSQGIVNNDTILRGKGVKYEYRNGSNQTSTISNGRLKARDEDTNVGIDKIGQIEPMGFTALLSRKLSKTNVVKQHTTVCINPNELECLGTKQTATVKVTRNIVFQSEIPFDGYQAAATISLGLMGYSDIIEVKSINTIDGVDDNFSKFDCNIRYDMLSNGLIFVDMNQTFESFCNYYFADGNTIDIVFDYIRNENYVYLPQETGTLALKEKTYNTIVDEASGEEVVTITRSTASENFSTGTKAKTRIDNQAVRVDFTRANGEVNSHRIFSDYEYFKSATGETKVDGKDLTLRTLIYQNGNSTSSIAEDYNKNPGDYKLVTAKNDNEYGRYLKSVTLKYPAKSGTLAIEEDSVMVAGEGYKSAIAKNDTSAKADGEYSFSYGVDTKATGARSAAFNHRSTASGERSFAVNFSEASGRHAFSANYGIASGAQSAAFGYATADGEFQLAAGDKTVANADALFKIGNNTSTNAFEVLRSGDANISGNLNVRGNLNIAGKTNIIDIETLNVKDNLVVLNSKDIELLEPSGLVIRSGYKTENEDGSTDFNDYAIVYNPGTKEVELGKCTLNEDGSIVLDDTHPVALRSEKGNWNKDCIPSWDAETNTFIPSGATARDFILINAGNYSAKSNFGGATVKDGIKYALSFGNQTQAKGEESVALNFKTQANGKASFAVNYYAEANGIYSFAANVGIANGKRSAAFGCATTDTDTTYQFAAGKYTAENTNALFKIGNGTGDKNGKNAFEVLSDGRATVQTGPKDSNDIVIKSYIDAKTAPLIENISYNHRDSSQTSTISNGRLTCTDDDTNDVNQLDPMVKWGQVEPMGFSARVWRHGGRVQQTTVCIDSSKLPQHEKTGVEQKTYTLKTCGDGYGNISLPYAIEGDDSLVVTIERVYFMTEGTAYYNIVLDSTNHYRFKGPLAEYIQLKKKSASRVEFDSQDQVMDLQNITFTYNSPVYKQVEENYIYLPSKTGTMALMEDLTVDFNNFNW